MIMKTVSRALHDLSNRFRLDLRIAVCLVVLLVLGSAAKTSAQSANCTRAASHCRQGHVRYPLGKYESSFGPSEPEAYRRDVLTA